MQQRVCHSLVLLREQRSKQVQAVDARVAGRRGQLASLEQCLLAPAGEFLVSHRLFLATLRFVLVPPPRNGPPGTVPHWRAAEQLLIRPSGAPGPGRDPCSGFAAARQAGPAPPGRPTGPGPPPLSRPRASRASRAAPARVASSSARSWTISACSSASR